MTSGPSKKELQDYWINNRQYFDELAKYYMESDREYYNRFIAPFYNQVFQSSGSIQKRGGSARLLLILIALFGVFVAAGVSFFILFQGSSDSDDDNKVIAPRIIQDSVKVPVHTTPDTVTNIKPVSSDDYDTGLKYYNVKNYSKAEEYFNQVQQTDKNYMAAQKKLLQIKIDRGDIKGDTTIILKNDKRNHPIERIR